MPGIVAPRTEDGKGIGRLRGGAIVGVAAAIATLVLPTIFLYISLYDKGGFFTFGSALVDSLSLLVLAGAILFLVSLFLYRFGFATLRKVDGRFTVASALCLIGSLGFILLIVAVLVLLGNSNSLVTCVDGHPSHALSCLESGQPLGAYTGLLGFWLGWIGGVGIVIGLASAGSRFQRGSIGAGSAFYAILLLVLIGPFIALVYAIPDQQYLLLILPLLSLLAPALVVAGTSAPLQTVRPA
jgi:hypothetical protein